MSTATPTDKPVRVLSFSQRLSKWDLKFSPYLYISPFFIMFAIVGLFPIAYTAVISFMDWDLVRNSGTFIGFDQYIWILQQPHFWTALRNTFSIFLLSTVPQLLLAVFIAAQLDRNIRAKTFWRMSVLLPFVVAPVAVGLIFNVVFADNFGLVNGFLTDIGLSPIQWHKEPFWSHVAIATMVNYRWTGYNALILLAFVVATMAVPQQLGVVPLYILFSEIGWTGQIGAIIIPALTSAFGVFWMTQYLRQAVPDELIEAARVDGASMIRTFWTVGVTAARPAAAMLFLFTFVGSWNQFFWPFIVLDRQNPTLPVALSLLQ